MTSCRQPPPHNAGLFQPISRGALAALFLLALQIGAVLASGVSPAAAQIFGERAPPVPPAPIGNTDPGSAMTLAPPTGPASVPLNLQAVPAPPPMQAGPPAGQGVLSLGARFGKDLPPITAGLTWRIYADKPDAEGVVNLVREEKSAAPTVVLPLGKYVVHCAFGLASAVHIVTVQQDASREVFDLPAGGLRIEGRVGSTRIPAGQIFFDIYRGSQFDTTERASIAHHVAAGDVVVLPEGTYYILSNYGDANSVVRSDIRVQNGKLTDVTIQHRAAVITLKLVTESGGEALANTSWSVISPGGDVIKEATGAFPSVVLAEGEYRAIARNEGHMFEHEFKVVTGVDSDVEVRATR